MHDQLAQFCQHFDGTTRPLLGPLDAALAELDPKDPAARALGDALVAARRQLVALLGKVEGQQAYVVIFGPLKSGKSTLMNAITGTYVSEVSSLPAYPCLVFVGHGARGYRISDYAGGHADFDDAEQLRSRIEQEHVKLAESIREIEASGAQFDPAQHFPKAIRRIDVAVPAAKLAASGAVLVDTPGLYTRMRFGYDRMTRDFRNTAACAIFVVKSDNLFLEQVFDEFDHLLAAFSKIFLVVNVDTTKRDVRPNGDLVPSLEQESPERIIEAFENLAMTTPLQEAARDGRLRLFAADLMSAASAELRGAADQAPPSFAAFRDELEAYLASPEYLLAFLGDTLRRAHGLAGEIAEVAADDYAESLRARAGERRAERERAQATLDRMARCLEHDWSEAFARSDAELRAEIERASRDQVARMARFMGAALDTWFLSTHGLWHLIDHEWRPLVREYCETVEQAARRSVEQSCGQRDGGLEVDPGLRAMLASFQVDVHAARRRALQGLAPAGGVPDSVTPLTVDQIPIRRGILDIAAFRSVQIVRDRLFGPADRPDRRIPARVKRSRLGEPAKHVMQQRLLQFRTALAKAVEKRVFERYGPRQRQATVGAIQQVLRAGEPALRAELGQLDEALAALRRVGEPLDALRARAADVRSKVHALASQYASADPDALLAPRGAAVLQPSPPPAKPAADAARRRSRPRARRGDR